MGAEVTRLGRFVRGRRFDRNPLRRPTDRIETVVLAVLVIAFLAGAPLAALAAGGWVHATVQRTQRAEQASRFPAQALVLKVDTLSSPGSFVDDGLARWRAPDGRVVTSLVPVPSGATVGQRIPLWTDRAGTPTTAPLSGPQVTGQTLLGGAIGVLAVAGLVPLAGELARLVLSRRRMAAWAADWRATAPRWTTRR